MKARCIGNDPFCPCQDGDMCHYAGANAWPIRARVKAPWSIRGIAAWFAVALMLWLVCYGLYGWVESIHWADRHPAVVK